MGIPELLGNTDIVVAVVAGISGLIRFPHLPRSLRYLALLTSFDAVMELTMLVLRLVIHDNLFLLPIIAVGEVGLMALVYRQVLQSPTFTRALPWAIGLFSVYALVNHLAGGAAPHYAPATQVVSDLLMLGMAGLYFRKLLNELRVEYLRRDPFFWLSACLAVYALGDLQISLFSNYLITHYSEGLQIAIIWGVRNLFNIQLYLCYCVLLWKRPQKQYLPSH